ncbi:MAG: 50S ribosomal protein L25 [Acidobacteriota bacterium]
MAQIIVKAEEREQLGKCANRRLRAKGKLPSVIYGREVEALPLSVEMKDVDQILRSESGHNTIFKLTWGKSSNDVLIKDYQLDPLHGTLLHADFLTISMDEKMTFAVPVHVEGTAVGVTSGGVLDLILREVDLECFPADLPDHLTLDVTDLDIGDSIRVKALTVDLSKVSVLSDPELVVLIVVPPHVEKEPEEDALEVETDLEAEGTAEPEVIKKGKEADEEETTDKE